MLDRKAVREKILSLYKAAAGSAKDSLAAVKALVPMMQQLIKDKAKMEGTALGFKETIAKAAKENEAFQKYIKDTPGVAKAISDRNYDPQTIYVLYESILEAMKSSFLKSKEDEAKLGEIEMKVKKMTETRVGLQEAAQAAVDAAKDQLKMALEDLEKANKAAEKVDKRVATTNITKLYNELKDKARAAAKEMAENLEKAGPVMEDLKKTVGPEKGKPEPKKEPSKEPAGKKPSAIEQLRQKFKAPAKTSLEGTPVTAANDVAAFESALEDLMSAESELMPEMAEFQESLSASDAAMDSAMSSLNEALSMEEAPEGEEAPAGESEEEGPGFMQQLKDVVMPPQMEMAPAPASVESPWVREADLKEFPSEHDLGGGAWELVESDGKSQLVIKKDLKSQVHKKMHDMDKGAFAKGETVCVDFGDYIEQGTVTAYLGEGMYHVACGPQSYKIPQANLFKSQDGIWR